ncbi:hypothetical protein Ocin01_08620 [Orchesella cincta]|uniref:Uncharacterized protein n=1 Tax=Orchesella cincta TaxID=48709 RepID=A0A1D2MYD7_ORCCI|nr:hypothetical protein Ocin01_08620 [Orchesella cincta]
MKNEAFGASIERSSDWNGETGIDSPINPMELAFPAFQRFKRTPDGCCSCGDHHCCGSMCHGK